MKDPHLETLELEPARTATASVIWMHGLGADATDFYSVVPQLGLPPEPAVRFVFPNAPRIPVTINMGMVTRAWYDVAGFERHDQDEPGIRQAATWINEVVAREVDRGIAPGRIVLAGFSQGGAMALFAGLRQPESLAGLLCLSGYLLPRRRVGGDRPSWGFVASHIPGAWDRRSCRAVHHRAPEPRPTRRCGVSRRME